MTALEIRIAAYAVLLLLLLGGAAWEGHSITARHYKALIAADLAAQNLALQEAQRNVIAAQQAQAAATQLGEQKYAELKVASSAANTRLLGSLRELQAEVHLLPVPTYVADTGEPCGASPGAGSPRCLRASAERLYQAVASAANACRHDSDELAALLVSTPATTR